MSVSKSHAQIDAAHLGFSLVELLVALVFTAILTTGMLRVFASSVSNFHSQLETLGIQRNSRWALTLLQEEVMQAGYMFPPRNLRNDLTLNSTGQPPLLLQTTDYTPVLTNPDGTTTTLPAVDEIQFLEDLNLAVEGNVVTTAVAKGAGNATIKINVGYETLLKYLGASSNLAMVFLDSQASQVDIVKVSAIDASAAPNYVITFDSSNTGLDQYGSEKSGGYFQGVVANDHAVGSPVTFISPLQVVRYTVVPRNLDPSSSTAMVPCLVRQATNITKGTIYSPTLTTATTWEQIIVEGVTSFKTDLSLDGGRTWLRYNPSTGALNANWDTWANIYSQLNSKVKARATALANYVPASVANNGIANAADPMWMNYIPVVIRIDLTVRTAKPRTEYAASGTTTAAYRDRTLTMMISPRNFSLGSPQ